MDKPGRIVIIRHGERVDQVYGTDWIEKCFNKKGEYVRFDLNMPKSIPKDKNKENLELDPPLSQIGLFQAKLIGESMNEENVHFQRVLCSPSLRCLQTCLELLQANKKNNSTDSFSQQVAIEPGLYDPIFLTKICPDWLLDEEIKSLGLDIDMNYQPIYTREKMQKRKENLQIFYDRLYHTINELLKQLKNQEGNTLIVTHAGTVSYIFRKLLHFRDPNMDEVRILLPYYNTYCIHIEIEEKNLDSEENVNNEMDKWKQVESSIPNFKHLNKKQIDWDAYELKLKEIL